MSYLKQTVWIVLVAVFVVGNTMATEEAEYSVVLKEQSFELRNYESHILAETIVDGDFDKAGNKAFRRLFKYISGNNKSQQKIAMTSPVGQGAEGEKIDMTSPVGQQQSKDSWAVSFMMPATYTMETVPEPEDPKIILRQVPARHMAAIQYSGLWSEKGYTMNKDKLEDNPPFTLWFMRRNEVLIPVEVLSEND